MWFNVLKNTARNQAYQSFIRSFILYDRVSLRPEHIEAVDSEGERKVRWYTPNKAWYWEFFIGSHRDAVDSTLRTTIKEHEPYTYYVENATMEEYPDNWKVFADLYRDNRETIKEKLYEGEEEEEEADTLFGIPTKKRLIRKIIFDWKNYMDHIIAIISSNVENIETNISTRRYQRLLASDINTSIPYKEVRDYIVRGPGLGTRDLPLATIWAIHSIYAKTLRERNPDIVWQNFARFIDYFRDEYIQHIFTRANNQADTEDLYQAKEDAIKDVSYQHMVNLARNIWANNPNAVETLMRQLPNYN